MIEITLPGGAKRQFDSSVTSLQIMQKVLDASASGARIAKKIRKSLPKDAVAPQVIETICITPCRCSKHRKRQAFNRVTYEATIMYSRED